MKRSVDIYVVLEKSFRSLFYKVFDFKTQVIDLLNPGTSRKPLMVRWSKKTRGFFVENLFTVECEELDDLQFIGRKYVQRKFTIVRAP